MLRTSPPQQQTHITKVVFSSTYAEFLGESEWTGRRSGGNRRGLDRALKALAILQTTLDLETLLRLFSREVAEDVAHSSMRLLSPQHDIELSIGRPARHELSFQMIVEQDNLGTLHFTRGKPFSQDESSWLEFMLRSLVYPLRNALQYQDAHHASMTDPLTGVFNRTMMEKALKRELALAGRHGSPLSFIVLDVDGFKAINDQHGHEAGDELIVQFAGALQRGLRRTDILSRFGGDEFTLLLSNTGREGALQLANHLRQRIADTAFRLPGIKDAVQVTTSLGVAQARPDDQPGDLFHCADEALYRAKNQGRNCVVAAN